MPYALWAGAALAALAAGAACCWVAAVRPRRRHLATMTPAAAAEAVLRTMSDGVLLSDPENRIVSANPSAEQLLGQPQDELVGQNVKELFPEGDLSITMVYEHYNSTREGLRRDITFHRPDGAELELQVAGSTVRAKHDRVVGVVTVLRDVTAQKHAERRLAHLAHHDTLTGLPNRLLLQDRLEQAVERVNRYGQSIAVMMLDLDRFKQVNDTRGHDTGDELLRQVADRLSSCVRSTDTVARMGGDEFVVIITDLGDAGFARTVAGRVLNALSRPYQANGHELRSAPSIGIAHCPLHAGTPEELLRKADLAMYESKHRGRATFTEYTAEMEQTIGHG